MIFNTTGVNSLRLGGIQIEASKDFEINPFSLGELRIKKAILDILNLYYYVSTFKLIESVAEVLHLD